MVCRTDEAGGHTAGLAGEARAQLDHLSSHIRLVRLCRKDS